MVVATLAREGPSLVRIGAEPTAGPEDVVLDVQVGVVVGAAPHRHRAT